MLVDAECHERYISFPPAFLPEELQTSRPDIILIEHAFCDFAALPTHYRRDPRVIVHIVEVGYTSDYLLHERRRTKLEQHSELCRNLSAFGWVNIRMHAFVVGHTGVMLAANGDLLTALGISSPRVGPFLAELAIASLQKSCAILSCFPFSQSAPALPAAVPPVLPTTHIEMPHAPPPVPAPTPLSLPLAPQHSPASHSPLMSGFTHAPSLLNAQPSVTHATLLPSSSPTLLGMQSSLQHSQLSHQRPPSSLHSSQHTLPLVPPPPILRPPRLPPRKRLRDSHLTSQTPTHAPDMQASPLHSGSGLPQRCIRRRCGRAGVAVPPAADNSSHDFASTASPASFTFDPGG